MDDTADPSAPFADLIDANEVAAATYTLAAETGVVRRGLAIVTCIDTRLDPLRMFGLDPGDAKFLRNAGARVTDDVERSLAVAVAGLGVERIAVIAHTGCKMASISQADAAAAVAASSGLDAAHAGIVDYLTMSDQLETLRADVDRLRACPLLPDTVPVHGFRFDLDTGRLQPIC